MNFLKVFLILFSSFTLIYSTTISQSTKLSRKIETLYNSARAGKSITCPFTETITCDSSEKYASFDGSCNNLLNPYYGKTTTPLKRILSSNYADGKDTPKVDLPNPRDISTTIFGDNEQVEKIWTHIYATFGQFLVHDLIETSLSSSDGTKPDCPCDSTDSACFSISLQANDILESTCMKFVRSTGSFDIKCDASQREQLNLITSFIDGNMIYGHSKSDSQSLRTLNGGLLLTSDGISSDKPYLPKSESTCSKADDSTMKCFKSGDSRTSENLGLTGIHTIFLREHNRIATELAKVNPDWSDNKLFKETRRIVVAILQHITYSQYIPGTIGNEGSSTYGLVPTSDNTYFTGYNSSINPQMTNEFVTAAMRFGHSVVTNSYDRFNSNNVEVDSTLTFSDINFKSEEAYNTANGGIDSFVSGLVNTQCAKLDLSIADDLQNKLKDSPDGELFDLAAFNINRGRDHGLRPYVDYVKYCTGKTITTEADLIAFGLSEKTVDRFTRNYGDIANIDLWVGGLAEPRVGLADVITGPTFTCIIGEQFKDLKQGDRFYYENAPDESKGTANTAFTLDQLAEIKKNSLSTLLCNAQIVDSIQPDVFFVENTGIRKQNDKVSCSSYEQMDLTKWKDV